MKKFNLTTKELTAAQLFVQNCLDGMGGARPADLANDEYTWVDIEVLTSQGYSRYEAAGLISSLLEKGFLQGEIRKGRPTEMFVNTEGWQWIESVWDSLVTTEAKEAPKHETREGWLVAASAIFRPWFQEQNVDYPERLRISCGLAGSRIGSKVIGECWSDTASKDKAREVFISPELDDASRVLDVLIHELCHAALPFEVKHGKPFAKLATSLGLTGKMTATVASDELKEKLKAVIEELGPYPHAALS